MSKRYASPRSIRRFLAVALLPIATATTLLATPKVAQANCAGGPSPAELEQPMRDRWAQLQQMQTYPWGTARVYDRLLSDRIVLASSFNAMTIAQKRQVIDLMQIQYPIPVYASDGRLVSAVYDDCTPHNYLFNERARFSWYYNAQGRSLPSNLPPEALRNAGNPAWRQVRFAIAADRERSVRTLFWSRMGYSQVTILRPNPRNPNVQDNVGLWIAWVPELGHFEINVPTGYNRQQLNRFLSVAPRQYRYVVVEHDGITDAWQLSSQP